MLLGYGKGGVGAAAALSLYWSDLKGKVAGLALVQSPYGGTPVASDMLREDQIGDKETRRVMGLLICKVFSVRGSVPPPESFMPMVAYFLSLFYQKGDMRALVDLTYERRKDFIMKHKLPLEIPLISFHSEASIAPGVLATMTHIAHAEVPWLPLKDTEAEETNIYIQSRLQVPVVMPLSSTVAIWCPPSAAQVWRKKRWPSLVTCCDTEVPGSVIVSPDRKLDHAWMVYSSSKRNPREADASEMCEAFLTLLVEHGRAKESSVAS